MRKVLVGIRKGKPVINWPAVLLVGLIGGMVAGAACAAAWFLLTREFSLPALVFPVALFVGYFVGEAIRTRFWVPPEQLTSLE